MRQVRHLLCSILFLQSSVFCDQPTPEWVSQDESRPQAQISVSSNPGSVNLSTGTGALGRYLFKLKEDSPVRVAGLWIADGDLLLTKCIPPGKQLIKIPSGRLSGNNLVILDLTIYIDKLCAWQGAMFGAEFLQFNGMDSNGQAGSVQGYDSMPVLPPFNRSELYQIWFRQELWDKKIIIRIGKTVPTYDFNNVLRPVPVQDKSLKIPAVSGLLYTPIFINPVNIGVLPGYYNSAYGITATFAPTSSFYINAGAYDGNLARGKQTGLEGPHFNGYYFYIAETGVNWRVGEHKKPGVFSVGGWYQTGELSLPNGVHQHDAQGIYAFGSQWVWSRNPGVEPGGISVFWQLGWNHAKTLRMNRFVGCGLTAFALTRPSDSFGAGMAWAWLNKRLFTRNSELMFQAYYQAHLFYHTFLEPVLTYIPTPGLGKNLPPTVALSLQMINLF